MLFRVLTSLFKINCSDNLFSIYLDKIKDNGNNLDKLSR